MKPKSSSSSLRLIMTAGSLIGFIGGWVIFGQTNSNDSNAALSTANSQALIVSTSGDIEPTVQYSVQSAVTATVEPTYQPSGASSATAASTQSSASSSTTATSYRC